MSSCTIWYTALYLCVIVISVFQNQGKSLRETLCQKLWNSLIKFKFKNQPEVHCIHRRFLNMQIYIFKKREHTCIELCLSTFKKKNAVSRHTTVLIRRLANLYRSLCPSDTALSALSAYCAPGSTLCVCVCVFCKFV